MTAEKLGRREAISFALGGIIGGGIFAVLGVVAAAAGPTAWIAYLLAGIVVLATGQSYVTLNTLGHATEGSGGAVTFIAGFLDRPTVAGMVGWTLLVGYVGTIAMYAYAFGTYFGAIFGLDTVPVLGVPTRPVLSALVVVGFVGLNVIGVRESGLVEDLLVGLKLLIIVAFSGGGIWYGYTHGQLSFGVARALHHPVGPVVAAGVAFVSFEGWQLLFYDQGSLRDPIRTVRTAVYVSIPVSTVAYVLVAFVTLGLVSQQEVAAHPDLALAIAADEFAGTVGYIAIGVAAVASTASAINATLFSTALFAEGLSTDGLIPDRLASTQEGGVPTNALLVIGGFTVLFTVYGDLTAITEFASLSFIVVFGVVDAVAFARIRTTATRGVALVGVVGTLLFFLLFAWHLYTAEFHVFVLVVVIAAALLLVEGLYFERDEIETGIESVEKRV